MRAIMVMFDSLRRNELPCYGGTSVYLPNFRRLFFKTTVFDNSYACSLPCMPARRELHTGRPNFLHRSWGPLEPFDDSMPELLKKNGIHARLSTDHYHYLQDGGATYHTRYSSWECFRGQESDPWAGDCKPRNPDKEIARILLNPDSQPEPLAAARKKNAWQNLANRTRMQREETFSQTRTFDDGIRFIEENLSYDNWFLQLEVFDPHEPFDSPEAFQKNWFSDGKSFEADWPPYAPVQDDEETVQNMRKKYYSLLQFCDKSLGRILDIMDRENLRKDTMLIVNTDHGLLLGEHGWWEKNNPLEYNEIAHTPLFIWNPRYPAAGQRRQALVQTIDLAPTLLNFFGIPIPKDMLGKSLLPVLDKDTPIRKYAIFGIHGGPINITDGRYVYMRSVRNNGGAETSAREYTWMPMHMNRLFSTDELKSVKLYSGFSFTKECPVLEIQTVPWAGSGKLKEDLLFDLATDPGQVSPIRDKAAELRFSSALSRCLSENDSPQYLYDRFGLTQMV